MPINHRAARLKQLIDARKEEPKINFERDAGNGDKQDFSGDPVNAYLREVCRVPKLTSASEIELAKAIERAGPEAEAAKVQLIESNLRLVVSIAERYSDRSVHILAIMRARSNESL